MDGMDAALAATDGGHPVNDQNAPAFWIDMDVALTRNWGREYHYLA
jgi:hypothetical protein